MLLFSFSIFSDQQSLKIENENNGTKTLTAETPYMGLYALEFSKIPWLTGTAFYGPKFVQATEVLLYVTELYYLDSNYSILCCFQSACFLCC